MPVDSRELERVADLWGRVAADRAEASVRGWADSPIVAHWVLGPRMGGAPGRHWLLALAEDLPLPRDGRWLSLGCGAAGTEIFAGAHGLFRSLVAIDGSEGALAEGAKAAAAQGVTGIEFACGDLNAPTLASAEFDVVLMNMSLHHVKSLETTLSAVEHALKPGGLFVINEFVGPSQFQFTDLQLALAASILEVLPDRWRTDLTTGLPKTRYVRQPRAHWNAVDPSEAIRSDEIVGMLEKRFEVVQRRDYGGTLLHLALEHIVHNFDRGDERDVAALRLVALVEELLIRHGVLESDFTLMVLRKAAPGSTAPERTRMPGVELEALRARVQVLEADTAELRARLERTEGSRVWRLAQALRGVVGRRW